MSGSRFDAGPGPGWDVVPEDVLVMHRRAGAKAIELADEPGADAPSVRREFSVWLRQLGEGGLAHLSEFRREHLVAVAQRSLEVYLRWRATRDLFVMLRKVIEVGIGEGEAASRGAMRACSPGEIGEQVELGKTHLDFVSALQSIQKPHLDLIAVLTIYMAPPKHRVILAEQGPGFLDRLPTDLGAALRDGDWTSMVPLALSFAYDLRGRLHSEYPDLMAFAEEAMTMPAVREALKAQVRRGAVDGHRARRLDTLDRDHDGGGNRDEG